ncbi:MAG TPA: hypothetical protein VK745_14135 [Polyangiaceae bacterium]|nr:hypothetical protein [Polyangiaceae bacterium]
MKPKEPELVAFGVSTCTASGGATNADVPNSDSRDESSRAATSSGAFDPSCISWAGATLWSRPFGSVVATDHGGNPHAAVDAVDAIDSCDNVLRSVNSLSSLGGDEQPFIAELLP